MSEFKDHFSSRAADYAAFRPSYPPAMVAFLAQQAPARDLALDCGAGSGQAARLLAEHFGRVVATDASAAQLAQAVPHPRIEYRRALAEESGLEAASVDLVTVAQALHWFALDRFYPEVRRVLKPAGLLAVWSYGLVRIDAAVDRVVDDFYAGRVGKYWTAERRHVDSGYASLPFPFPELPNGPWSLEVRLDRRALVGYVGTWSAVSRCQAAEGSDPLREFEADLAAAWPDAGASKPATWPVILRVGKRPE